MIIEEKRTLLPYSDGPGYRCAHCAFRKHPENRIASVCMLDGRKLDSTEVFSRYCESYKKGKSA